MPERETLPNKMPEDKDELNGKNRKNDPDNKNEQNGKENKKEKKKWKKKLNLKCGKLINKSKHLVKDLRIKIFHNKEKSPDNATPPLLPDIDSTDLTGYYFPDIEENDEDETFQEELEEWIHMAQRVYSGWSTDNKSREVVEALYMPLKQRAFGVIKDSISSEGGNQLKEAIQVIEDIEEREHKDPRPQGSWKTELEACVASSVIEQVDSLPKFSREVENPCLGEVLATLGKTMKSGLTHVIKNLKPHFPEDFDVGNTYALQYHQKLRSVLSLITEYELYINEIHALLSFTQSSYPSILRDPVLINHINVAQLEELLPSEKVCHLEKMYILDQKEQLEQLMTKTLRREEDQWKEGQPPDMLESVFPSALSEDILQMYDGNIKAAEAISENFENKLTPILANVFLGFLQRYKSSIYKHCNKNKSKAHFMDIIIANLNCCDHFRVFIERTSVGEDMKKKIYTILSEIEDQGFSVLLNNFFQEIQPCFRRIRRTKGLKSEKIMSEIITTSREYVSSVTTLSTSCRQVMAAKVHMHLVIEYLTDMKDIRHCDIDEQKALAAQMHRTADLLHHFCTDHLSDAQMSKATWENGAIRKTAEIVQLQDLAAIKLDVGVLTSEYPDIRKRHVKSFLQIKNTLNMCERMSVVKIMEGIKREDPLSRCLFTFIPCMPCCCLIF
ncbi:tumor necrosis factor alpha-induced protein 2-like isoform X2 [Bufo bufo]|uniref:tumor necrosis factor alpha-induced protein 2-like isoform X2 n=1 Tax=Bufo bufo TaxID=8384 RepID=UPI001ABE2966|nr:tumor necrosis factor alpha-induced protein 2-like isoform X2 [Bufo bufo]